MQVANEHNWQRKKTSSMEWIIGHVFLKRRRGRNFVCSSSAKYDQGIFKECTKYGASEPLGREREVQNRLSKKTRKPYENRGLFPYIEQFHHLYRQILENGGYRNLLEGFCTQRHLRTDKRNSNQIRKKLNEVIKYLIDK